MTYGDYRVSNQCHAGNHDGCGYPVPGWMTCQCPCHVKLSWRRRLARALAGRW
jgi:hypothetical protein